MTTTSDFVRAHGLAHKLFLAGEKASVSPAHWNALAENQKLLGNLPALLAGHAVITALEHLIDCDADPFVPNGWSVWEHRKGGMFQWDPAKVKLWLGQKGGQGMYGDALRAEIAKKKGVLNANVLDYLLAHPHLIPEEWSGKGVFFWGTIYQDTGGGFSVRLLCRNLGRWNWHAHWLDSVLGSLRNDHSPVALLES